MHQSKIENILKMDEIERYQYFIRKVADFEQIWGLYNDGWATLGTLDSIIIPFWPEKVFAKYCATDEWLNYYPKTINIYDFINNWLPSMKQNNQKVLIFMTPNKRGIMIPIEELLSNLRNELGQYD